jgi:hypothetical protein
MDYSSGFKIRKFKDTSIHRTVILLVVLHGYWYFTLMEMCLLRMLENKMFRRIFGPKMAEVTGVWKIVLNPLKPKLV